MKNINKNFIDVGPYRRKGVKEYSKWINSLPKDKVLIDVPMKQTLERMGYHIEEKPASLFDVDQMWDALSLYGEGEDLNYSELLKLEGMKEAYSSAWRAFGSDGKKLSPLKTQDEYWNAMTKDASAGLPYFSKKEAAFPIAWGRYKDILSEKKSPNPCLAQFRTQRGNKTRLVWAYPMDMTLAEAKYARPLMQHFKTGLFPVPWGRYRYEVGARLYSTLTKRFNVALDYSKFDSSISPGFISMAFNILKSWFEDKDLDSWDLITRYFVTTPIVMPDGHLYKGKRKGVPSGSYFTNLVDSIVNFIVIKYLSNVNSLNLHSDSIHIMGDDSVFSTNKNVSLDKLSSDLLKIGVSLNVNKCQVTSRDEPIHFIGFDWSKGSAYKDLNEVLTSAVYPERYRNFKSRSAHVNTLLYAMTLLNPKFRHDVSKYLGATRYEILFRMGSKLTSKGDSTLSGYLDYTHKYVLSKDKVYVSNFVTGVLQ